MNKKIKILLIAILSVVFLTSIIVGTILIVNSNNDDTTEEKIYELITSIDETEQTFTYKVTINEPAENANLVLLKYKKGDQENEIELNYNEEKQYYFVDFAKKNIEQILTNVQIKYCDKWYDCKDIQIDIRKFDSIYTQITLNSKVLYDGCFLSIDMSKPYAFTAEVYLNDKFIDTFELNDKIGFSLPYEDTWLDENIVTLKNIEFYTEGVYADNLIENKFKIFTESSLLYCDTDKNEIYYFEDEILINLQIEKTMNFSTEKVIINNKEYDITNLKIEGNAESFDVSLKTADLEINEENQYIIQVDKVIFAKGTLEINKSLQVEILEEKITSEIYVQNEYYLEGEERKFEIYLHNPYSLTIEKIIVNNEEKEIFDNENYIVYSITNTKTTEIMLEKVIFSYEEKQYELELNTKKSIIEIIMPTTFEIKEDILTVENDKYIKINFDKTVENKEIIVSYYLDGNAFERKTTLSEDKTSALLNVTEEVFEIKEYNFVLNYIDIRENNVSKLLYDSEIDYYTLINYSGVKSIEFYPMNGETGEIELSVKQDENLILKEITFKVLDDEGTTIVEDWFVTVNYNSETNTYSITSPYETARVKITSITYELDGLTYYSELPLKEEIILI